MSTQKKPMHKTFNYILVSTTGNKCYRSYKCSSMVDLLEHVKHELEVYSVDYWKIVSVDYNYLENV